MSVHANMAIDGHIAHHSRACLCVFTVGIDADISIDSDFAKNLGQCL